MVIKLKFLVVCLMALGFVACSNAASSSAQDEQVKEEIIKNDSTATEYQKLQEEIETTSHALDQILEEL